jgi:hypothetical protein
MGRCASRERLGSPLERNDREMSPLGVEANGEIELGSGLTPDKSLRCGARRPAGPSRAGFKTRSPAGPALSVVDLVGRGAVEPGMRPVAVVPEEVERQLVLEGGEAVGDQDQTPRALGFDGSDGALDHRQAPMLAKRSEAMLNAPAPAPPLESLREELFAPVREEMLGYLPRLPKKSIKKRANRFRGGLRTIDRESDRAS